MRFLFLNQFYLPDVAPTGRYLHDVAQVLVQAGHQVKVICSRRSYDGTKIFPRSDLLNGVEVVRLPATGFGRRGFIGKLADYASFYGLLLAALLFERKRPDVILSLTTPPYIGLLGKLAAKRHGCRHAHWIMDLYPDVMLAHGMARTGLLICFLRKLTRFQLKGADPIFALGPTMAKNVSAYLEIKKSELLTRQDEPTTVHSIPLWSNPELGPWPDNEPNPLRADRNWTSKDVVFLYSGNMGLGHRFGEFLEAAKRLGSSGPRWVFAGDGKRKPEIVAAAGSIPATRIDFLDYVPRARLRAHLCAADVHLASLDSSWQGLMVPSKLQGSFAVGRPVIYVGGRQCEIAVWIQASGGGWVVDENDLIGLLEAVQQSLDVAERRKRGRAALEFARQNFAMSTNCTRLARLLEGGSFAPPEEISTGKEEKPGSDFPTSSLTFNSTNF
jgi:colanic acid biosynthesis glycosyl transferase WcaI